MSQEIRTFKTKRTATGIFFKWLFIAYNLVMLIWLFSYWVQVSPLLNEGSDAERAGAAIGTTLATGMIMITWATGVVILGIPVLLTKGKIVEVIEHQGYKNENSSNTGLLLLALMGVMIFFVVISGEKVKQSSKNSEVDQMSFKTKTKHFEESYTPPSQTMKEEAIKIFQENPEGILNLISIYVENKKWDMVRSKTDALLDSNNPDILKWHKMALENLDAPKKSETQIHEETSEKYTPSNWINNTSISEMDDSPEFIASTQSLNTVKTWLDEVTPTLTIRCKENTTDLIFNAQTNFDAVYGRYSEARIRYRIDQEEPVTEHWTESTDGKAAFSGDAIKTLQKMADAETLLVEFIPHNANPATAKFNISGLRPMLEKISKTCNWKL